MKSEWKKCTLSDVIDFKNGKKRPSGIGKFPVYGGNGILNFCDKFNYDNCIIIGRVGVYCGCIYREKEKCWISDNAICGISKNNSDIEYLYYLLKFLRLNKRRIGTGQPLLTQEILNNIKIIIPKKGLQIKISKILRSLDDKIELNNKINKNLFEMMQTYYRGQFYNLKYHEPCGRLDDICEYSKDKVLVSNISLGNYYSTENMLPEKAGAVEASNLPTAQKTTKCKAGDVLISNIRPYFKKIAYCSSEGGCSADVLCFVPKRKELSAYLYSTLYDDSFFSFMVSGSKGTKMPRGDKKQIMTYGVYIPTDKEIEIFNAIAVPVLNKIESAHQENIYLASLRDALLPRLMSGELDVSEFDI